MDISEIKNMHSKELRELRTMIREELDFRADVGKEILELELLKVNKEISNYPTPITGCDEQFNYLLSRRSELEKQLSCPQDEKKRNLLEREKTYDGSFEHMVNLDGLKKTS